jgi:hypothetical protein
MRDVLRLGMGLLLAQLLLGLVLGAAMVRGPLVGGTVLLAAIAGLSAGLRVSLRKERRPQRAAHLISIGAALSALSLRMEQLSAPSPSGISLAPLALLLGAAIIDALRERAMRVRDPVLVSPFGVLAALAGAAMGVVLAPMPLTRLTGVMIAGAIAASATVLSATFFGGPGRPVARPFDAAVLYVAGAVSLALLVA